MTYNNSNLGEALAYEAFLAVSWEQPTSVSNAVYFKRLNQENEETLKNILVLEKHHSDLTDDDSDRYVLELAHIDFKINLLLDLMVQVFSKQLSIPPEFPVSMTSSRLQWQSDQPLSVGCDLFINIFLSPRFPRPLTLYGKVSSAAPHKQDGFSIVLDFDQISPPVQTLLERFIFMKHRRMVASARRG